MKKIDIVKIPNIESTVKKIINKEISVVELVLEHLNRIEAVDSELNSIITVLKEDAIEKAKVLDELIIKGDEAIKQKKLLGIPFTVKDLYQVKGTKTTFGSKLMEDYVAPYTSTVVQKCLDEGAILIGKTNCDPWGFGSTGENSGYGFTRNPYDLERPAGGSSSGSASSLASGIGFFSLGTDTGGSVRLPASINGLFALKPTYGRNSRYGIGVMGSSFDTPGFFARHIEDIKLLEEIMQGRDINDSTTSELKDSSSYKNKSRKYKIGKPVEFFKSGIDDEIRGEIEKKLKELESKGHEIVDINLPTVEYALPAYYILVPSEISSNRARYDGVRFGKKVSDSYEENLIDSRSRYFEDEVKRRIMIGTYNLSAGFGGQFYKKASIVRTKLKNEFDEAFELVDFICAPTLPVKIPKIGGNLDDPLANYLLDIYNVTANLVGIPSLAIPLSLDRTGFPIGMQFMARANEDLLLMDIA